MPEVLSAGLWGFLSGAALLVGAAAAYFLHLSKRFIAGIMAFGAGVLLSAIAFELMDEAFDAAGLLPAGIGFVSGAVIYTGAMLAMVADTMIPEAYAITHEFAGLITVAGFLTSFAITKLG
jgi:ZIP family zinc transporter